VTARRRVARQVGCAGVAIVAVQRRSRSTRSALAGLDPVADIGIRACLSIPHISVCTAACRIAGIDRADIAVIAVLRITGARPVDAALIDGALAGIGAIGVVGVAAAIPMLVTAGRRVARQVSGTGIAIVAIQRRAGNTAPAGAFLDAVAYVGAATPLS